MLFRSQIVPQDTIPLLLERLHAPNARVDIIPLQDQPAVVLAQRATFQMLDRVAVRSAQPDHTRPQPAHHARCVEREPTGPMQAVPIPEHVLCALLDGSQMLVQVLVMSVLLGPTALLAHAPHARREPSQLQDPRSAPFVRQDYGRQLEPLHAQLAPPMQSIPTLVGQLSNPQLRIPITPMKSANVC